MCLFIAEYTPEAVMSVIHVFNRSYLNIKLWNSSSRLSILLFFIWIDSYKHGPLLGMNNMVEFEWTPIFHTMILHLSVKTVKRRKKHDEWDEEGDGREGERGSTPLRCKGGGECKGHGGGGGRATTGSLHRTKQQAGGRLQGSVWEC